MPALPGISRSRAIRGKMPLAMPWYDNAQPQVNIGNYIAVIQIVTQYTTGRETRSPGPRTNTHQRGTTVLSRSSSRQRLPLQSMRQCRVCRLCSYCTAIICSTAQTEHKNKSSRVLRAALQPVQRSTTTGLPLRAAAWQPDALVALRRSQGAPKTVVNHWSSTGSTAGHRSSSRVAVVEPCQRELRTAVSSFTGTSAIVTPSGRWHRPLTCVGKLQCQPHLPFIAPPKPQMARGRMCAASQLACTALNLIPSLLYNTHTI